MLDLKLIKSVKNEGCSGCFCKLLELHSNLFYKICNRYIHALSSYGVPRGDVYENKNFVFLDSITTFDPSRGVKFTTWLANKTRFYCLNLINSRKRTINFSNDDIRKAIENRSFFQKDDKEVKENFDYVMFLLDNLKDKRVKQIFSIRYLEGSKKIRWKNIASSMNISVQTAINLHSKGIRVLSGKMNSKEIYDSV